MKYRKQFKGRIRGKATSCNTLQFGEYGLVSTDKAKLTSRQIEAARIAINRSLKRGGQLIIRIFPHKPVTKRPAEVRMGKGKGAPEYFVARVSPGRILFESDGVPLEVAKEAMRLGAQKLPVLTRFIVRRDYSEETL